MVIKTTRFGKVNFDKEDVITFPEGLLGFANFREFIFVDDPSDEIFIWLQSCESENIAFPVLEPEFFSEEYNVTLNDKELNVVGLSDISEARLFNIVTIPEDPRKMTANMKAPLVINVKKKLAKQCVLQDNKKNKLEICEPIFLKLQQRVVQNPLASLKKGSEGLGVPLRGIEVDPTQGPKAEL